MRDSAIPVATKLSIVHCSPSFAPFCALSVQTKVDNDVELEVNKVQVEREHRQR